MWGDFTFGNHKIVGRLRMRNFFFLAYTTVIVPQAFQKRREGRVAVGGDDDGDVKYAHWLPP